VRWFRFHVVRWRRFRLAGGLGRQRMRIRLTELKLRLIRELA